MSNHVKKSDYVSTAASKAGVKVDMRRGNNRSEDGVAQTDRKHRQEADRAAGCDVT